MIEQITVNPINEKLFSAEFLKGFRCGAKRQYQADVEEIAKAKFGRQTADRPKNMIHIDEVYRLIAGHSNYHGDSILSAFTCLVEGKDVKPIAPLDESADRPTGEWVFDEDGYFHCEVCGRKPNDQNTTTDYCPHCGARLGGDTE